MRERRMFSRIMRWLWQRLYRVYGVRHGVTLGRNVHLGLGTILWAPNRLIVGDDVFIGKTCTVECDGRIGATSMLANQVGLVGRHDHDVSVVGESVRHSPWIGEERYDGRGRGESVIIGPDVWVGFGSIILSGVRIGRGAIVAAGALVPEGMDVPANTLVMGTPAKVKRPVTAEEQERFQANCLNYVKITAIYKEEQS